MNLVFLFSSHCVQSTLQCAAAQSARHQRRFVCRYHTLLAAFPGRFCGRGVWNVGIANIFVYLPFLIPYTYVCPNLWERSDFITWCLSQMTSRRNPRVLKWDFIRTVRHCDKSSFHPPLYIRWGSIARREGVVSSFFRVGSSGDEANHTLTLLTLMGMATSKYTSRCVSHSCKTDSGP